LSGCGYERAASVVRIGPGEIVDVVIDPASTHLQGTTGQPAFGEGAYRLVLAWRTQAGPEGATSASATSEEFRVER
jgi:hypothetical protein